LNNICKRGEKLHQEEIELEVLRSLGKVTNQRTIADEIGYSAGKVNYVLKKLIEKGLVKVDRFVNSKSKIQYKYLLTPEGIKEKIALTDKFIEIKKEEYDNLQKQKKEYEEMYDLSNLNKCPNK
jgi:EPS-associated MarR family transcriptional regulator